MVFLILLPDDAPSTLLLSDADLLDGVGGEGMGCWDERGFSAVAILISDIANLSESTFREWEAVGKSTQVV